MVGGGALGGLLRYGFEVCPANPGAGIEAVLEGGRCIFTVLFMIEDNYLISVNCMAGRVLNNDNICRRCFSFSLRNNLVISSYLEREYTSGDVEGQSRNSRVSLQAGPTRSGGLGPCAKITAVRELQQTARKKEYQGK